MLKRRFEQEEYFKEVFDFMFTKVFDVHFRLAQSCFYKETRIKDWIQDVQPLKTTSKKKEAAVGAAP